MTKTDTMPVAHDQVQVAANMAGEWWAKRLSERYAEKRPALAKAVAERVAQALNGAAYFDWQGERIEGDSNPFGS